MTRLVATTASILLAAAFALPAPSVAAPPQPQQEAENPRANPPDQLLPAPCASGTAVAQASGATPVSDAATTARHDGSSAVVQQADVQCAGYSGNAHAAPSAAQDATPR